MRRTPTVLASGFAALAASAAFIVMPALASAAITRRMRRDQECDAAGRNAAGPVVLRRLLERRAAGVDGSAAPPRGYDGLVAGAPAQNATRSYLAGHLWAARATELDPESYIPAAKMRRQADRVLRLERPQHPGDEQHRLLRECCLDAEPWRQSRGGAGDHAGVLSDVPRARHATLLRRTGNRHFDMLEALEKRVEKGQAPASIPATHRTAGRVDRSRPLCPYPQVAAYSGSGSTDAADNFSCRMPQSAGAAHPIEPTPPPPPAPGR